VFIDGGEEVYPAADVEERDTYEPSHDHCPPWCPVGNQPPNRNQ
jgi:hypothetical protein